MNATNDIHPLIGFAGAVVLLLLAQYLVRRQAAALGLSGRITNVIVAGLSPA